MAVERFSVASLPAGFDPDKHAGKIIAKVCETKGDGWEVESYDPAERRLVLTRQGVVTQTTAATKGQTLTLALAKGTRPTDGDRIASKFEDANPGYTLTEFKPFLGQAVMRKLSIGERQARDATAYALGMKPYDIRVSTRRGGGYSMVLPSYSPSKHDTKLDEVATTVVGQPGWYTQVDPATSTVQMIPAELPTFQKGYPYPFSEPTADIFRVPVGVALGGNGRPNETAFVDLDGTAGVLVTGLAGSGKAQPLTSRIPVPVSDRFPDGWALLGALRAGDTVFAADGTTTRVVAVSDTVRREVFEVHLSDGQVVETAGDHLWRAKNASQRQVGRTRQGNEKAARGDARRAKVLADVRRLREMASGYVGKSAASINVVASIAGVPYTRVRSALLASGLGSAEVGHAVWPVDECLLVVADALEATTRAGGRFAPAAAWSIVTTQQMADTLMSGSAHLNWSIDVAEGFDAAEADLLVDPYVLGYWLGDGTGRTGGITVGGQDVEHVQALLEDAMGRAADRSSVKPDERAWTISFGRPDQSRCKYGHPRDTERTDPRKGSYSYLECAHCPRESQRKGSDGRAPVNLSLCEALRVVGVRQNQKGTAKHIPAAYLRGSFKQRLALLQGLMDSDGHIDQGGSCEITLSDPRLAEGVLELVRSLGIKAATPSASASGYRGTNGERVVCKDRYRIHFTTDLPVARLPRKAERLPAAVRTTQDRIFVTQVVRTGRAVDMRCLHVDNPDHLYLTDGFVPTHNSVWTTSFLFSLFRRGWQVAVVNAPQKKTDFEWAKPFVRENGWGCESKADAVAVARLIHEEGVRRGQLLATHGVSKWQELPADARKKNPPLILVADEMAAQLMKEAEPKGLPKDHPQRLEVQQENLESDLLAVTLAKIPAEMRAAGIRVLYLTQQAQANFGIGPKIKVNLPHRVLLGSKPSKQQLGHAFQVPEKLPGIPEHIVADEAQARGVGITEFEGQTPQVFKGYYAPGSEFVAQMRKAGVPTTNTPRPTPPQVARLVPQIADELPDDGPPSSAFDAGGFGQQDGRDVAAGDRLKGAAAASHALAVDAALAAKRQRAAASSDDDF